MKVTTPCLSPGKSSQDQAWGPPTRITKETAEADVERVRVMQKERTKNIMEILRREKRAFWKVVRQSKGEG